MTNIPDNITHLYILPKLPVKSLFRFKCVSKSWNTLITSSDFIRLHHRHALSSDKNRLIISTRLHPSAYFHVYNLDSPLDPPSKCSYPNPETLSSYEKATVVASCEFFLLLRIGSHRQLNQLFLLNPSTCSYHEIPCQNFTNYDDYPPIKYGICFDEANDDYKVIRVTRADHQKKFLEVMIYSFKTNLWRLIEHKLTLNVLYNYHRSNDVFIVDNLLYTLLTTNDENYKENVWIGCFDIEAEKWTNDIPLPENDISDYYLRLMDGSICVVGHEKTKHGAHCVWVMKDRHWVKIMRTDFMTWWHQNLEYHPITYRTGSRDEILCVRKTLSLLCWYNIRDKVATYAAFNKEGCIHGAYEFHIEHVCKGSLVTFPNTLPSPNQEIESTLFPSVTKILMTETKK